MRNPGWHGGMLAMLVFAAVPSCRGSSGSGNHDCFGLSCVRNCQSDADCPALEYCGPTDPFSGQRQCLAGCRDDGECAPLLCVAGDCEAGCRVHDDCPAGRACSFRNASPFDSLRIGECIEGCRDDTECVGGEFCVCLACTPNACNSNDDCGPDAYCPTGLQQIVEGCDLSCRPLPPPLECGASLCRSTSVSTTIQEFPVSACCAGGGAGECGLETEEILGFGERCEALGQPGGPDPSCGPEWHFGEVVFAACRRPDGRCGHRVDILNLGCVAHDP